MKHCKLKNCETKVEAKGYCRRHYLSFMRYGEADYIDNKRNKKDKEMSVPELALKDSNAITKDKCKILGCDKIVKCRGLCEMHYTRLRRNGQLETKTFRSEIKENECIAFNCNREPLRHGMCSTHITNLRELSTPYRAKIIKLCGVNGCEEKHFGKGLCKKHYKQWERVTKTYKLDEFLGMNNN